MIDCRVCGSKLEVMWELGNFANCGRFPEDNIQEIQSWPLNVGCCETCGLFQLDTDYPPTEMYGANYGYRSNLNSSMLDHLNNLAFEIANFEFGLSPEDSNDKLSGNFSHLDIGSNDASLLILLASQLKVRVRTQEKSNASFKLFGIDPSGDKFRDVYEEHDFTLISDFFSGELLQNRQFDCITSIAMFYDLPSPVNFARDVSNALTSNGVWISEQSYLPRMIEQNAFDTICHEHAEYYTLRDIENICEYVGLRVFDVVFNDVNGGSFRFYACKKSATYFETERLTSARLTEKNINLREQFLSMKLRVEEIRRLTLEFLTRCHESGLIVHGLGASTKGNTLLQYFGVSNQMIACIAEVNEEKYGKFTPGTKIPILSQSQSLEMLPDYYFVLPWHFKENIIENLKRSFNSQNIPIVFPLPEFEVWDYFE